MGVTVRYAEQGDKEAWIDLWHKYLTFYKTQLPSEVDETNWKRFFDDSEPVWCAVAVDESDGTVVGFVTWLQHRSTWAINDYIYLNDLFVDESRRLKGTGRKLIEFVYADKERRGVAKVYWHTQNFNHRAQMLYTKVGVAEGFVSYRDPSA